MSATEESIVTKKDTLKICFDVIITTKHVTFYCEYCNCIGEVHDSILTKGMQISIAITHAISGHGNEFSPRKTFKYLGWEIRRGVLETCKSCAIIKA